jgi:hypothetical protein
LVQRKSGYGIYGWRAVQWRAVADMTDRAVDRHQAATLSRPPAEAVILSDPYHLDIRADLRKTHGWNG